EALLKRLIEEDPSVESEIAAVSSVEELKEVFAKRGVELSTEELDELFASATGSFAEGELDEEDMDKVAGGISLKQALSAWRVGARIGIGARMIYDHFKHGNAQYTYTLKQLKKGTIFG
ncbi:MAG: hypothetical protein IK095_03805, partial [Oscillospiraceae bacterium]|nr:hypothetical protein [Oscillospiraceae bacterium]